MQVLHIFALELFIDDYGVSDALEERFGVREISSHIDPVLGGHVFSVNGTKVRCRQGWPCVTCMNDAIRQAGDQPGCCWLT